MRGGVEGGGVDDGMIDGMKGVQRLEWGVPRMSWGWWIAGVIIHASMRIMICNHSDRKY